MQPWPAVDDRDVDRGSHVVVGSDADIVLMALVCSTSRVYVMPDVRSLPPSFFIFYSILFCGYQGNTRESGNPWEQAYKLTS